MSQHNKYYAKLINRSCVDVIENLDVQIQDIKTAYELRLKELSDELDMPERERALCFNQNEENFRNTIELLEQYKPLIIEEKPVVSKDQEIEPYYEIDNNVIVQRWEIVSKSVGHIIEEINTLKNTLVAGDYKIIKCYEYYMLGKPLPYDLKTLHENNETTRERINELENRLKDLQ